MESKSSPETIAASLNETEWRYSLSQRKLHGNARRVYPFWKTCQNCSKPFQTRTKEQALRNKTCSAACMKACIGAANSGCRPIEEHKGKSQATCVSCGTTFWRNTKWLAKADRPACSKRCNGLVRGQEWKKHAHKGRAAWRPESEAALRKRFTGPSNPSWKGGVTYRKRRGNYVSVRYVRCPQEFRAMARTDGYVMEHRLVVARIIGRCLTRAECVHHIDHKPLNNCPTNLMLFATNKDHKLFEHGAAIEPLWDGSRLSTTMASSGASRFVQEPSSP
jgi:hypothetical protein